MSLWVISHMYSSVLPTCSPALALLSQDELPLDVGRSVQHCTRFEISAVDPLLWTKFVLATVTSESFTRSGFRNVL